METQTGYTPRYPLSYGLFISSGDLNSVRLAMHMFVRSQLISCHPFEAIFRVFHVPITALAPIKF